MFDNKIKKEVGKQIRKIWLTATIFTVFLIYIEAVIGKWFVSLLLGIDIGLFEAIIITIITNLIVGLFNGFKLYAKAKRKD